MATQLGDTLTTRNAVRQAALDDLLARCELAAVAIEGGALDGVQVVSLGTLRDKVVESLLVDLPPVSDRYAEVSTPASIEVDAICPECGESVDAAGKLLTRLTVQDGITEISLKFKSKAVMHLHGQQRLPVTPGQVGAFDGNEVEPAVATPAVVFDLLVLVDEARPWQIVSGWDQVTLELVADWARANHLQASDNDDVEIPDMPGVIAETTRIEAATAERPMDDEEPVEAETPEFMRDDVPDEGGAAQRLADVAEQAVEQAGGEMAEVETAPRCDGSNHVPGCEHFPQIPKRTPGDA